MGNKMEYKCRRCGKKYSISLGIGFFQPTVAEDTVKAIAAGKYGKEWKEAYEKGGEGLAVTAEETVYVCEKCGNWANLKDISLYAPDKPSASAGHFIMRDDEGWHIYKQYIPVCSKCGGAMKEVEEINSLPCPKCGEVNEPEEMWMVD